MPVPKIYFQFLKPYYKIYLLCFSTTNSSISTAISLQMLMNVSHVLAMFMPFVPTIQDHTRVLAKKDMMEMVKPHVMVCIPS